MLDKDSSKKGNGNFNGRVIKDIVTFYDGPDKTKKGMRITWEKKERNIQKQSNLNAGKDGLSFHCYGKKIMVHFDSGMQILGSRILIFQTERKNE